MPCPWYVTCMRETLLDFTIPKLSSISSDIVASLERWHAIKMAVNAGSAFLVRYLRLDEL